MGPSVVLQKASSPPLRGGHGDYAPALAPAPAHPPAQRRLEVTEEPVDLVAQECGFGRGATAGASLRQHFKRVVGVSPTDYRRVFGRAQELPGSQGRVSGQAATQ